MPDCIHSAGVTRTVGDCAFCEIDRLKHKLWQKGEEIANARREALESLREWIAGDVRSCSWDAAAEEICDEICDEIDRRLADQGGKGEPHVCSVCGKTVERDSRQPGDLRFCEECGP